MYGENTKTIAIPMTGIVKLNKESELLEEFVQVACLLNLPELELICKNAQKGDEFLFSRLGTQVLFGACIFIVYWVWISFLLFPYIRLPYLHVASVLYICTCE